MSTRTDAGSPPEVLKLAHQLGVDTSRLDFLSGVAADDLRALRQQIGDALFEADRHHFGKVVAVSRVVPAAMAARITEHALPPLIAARTAELLESERAIDMVARLSDTYLADVSAAMDPARAPELVARIPPATVSLVGRELALGGEWVVMGSFVSLVSGDALGAAVGDLTGEQLLRVGYVLEDLSRLDDIVAMLADDQLDEVLLAAIEHDLWRELDGLLANLGPQSAARVADLYAAADPAVPAAVGAGSLSPAGRAVLERG